MTSTMLTTCTRGLLRPGKIHHGESSVSDGEIHARGIPIGELIQQLTFIESIFFQLQARLPDQREHSMMNAYLVSLCEHGVTSPSTHGPRIAASVRAPFPASAISFIAGAMGEYHFGALEKSMRDLVHIESSGESAEAFVERHIKGQRRIWGYGHRFHKSSADASSEGGRQQEDADPRVHELLSLADQLGWDGQHLQHVREIGRILYQCKRTPINIDGVAAGLLLDMGFSPETAMLFVIIGRLPNIARLHSEEQGQRPNRFTALATARDPGFDRTVERDHSDNGDEL